jgi:hypothetical protein
MKRLRMILLALALGSIGACRQSDMRTVVIRLPQVTNAACENRVRGALQKLKGIDMKALAFDREAGTLTLRYESMIIAHKNIEHAIIAVGFDANELTADAAARATLPPECGGIAAATNAAAAAALPLP